MTKKCFAAFAAILLLLLTACGIVNCGICGDRHRRNVMGGTARIAYFEVFARDSRQFLRIYVESCWGGSAPPDLRLSFVARYDIAGLYEAISQAESNIPFGVTFADETITLTTDRPSLEAVYITYHEQQPEVGFSYHMRRLGE